jgi:hypothetical protein
LGAGTHVAFIQGAHHGAAAVFDGDADAVGITGQGDAEGGGAPSATWIVLPSINTPLPTSAEACRVSEALIWLEMPSRVVVTSRCC